MFDSIFHCLIVGSRNFDDYPYFSSKMDILLSNHFDIEVVSGGCRGTDTMAKLYAEEYGYDYKEFPTDWSQWKKAGYLCNKEMHQYIAQFEKRGCVAFWNGDTSSGTAHSFQLAQEYQTPIRVVRIDM